MAHASRWSRGVLLAAVLCTCVRPASAQDVRIDHDSTARVVELGRPAGPVIGQTRRSRETAGSAKVIELDSLAPKPLGDFSDVLSSRIPGMLVEQPSGATGAGARIHIRGINGLILPGDPLVIVDGVRVANATTVSTVDVGGQAPSRLDALDPEEIETIEVLPGPASAAMYGGDAADGVILITTRHGQPGRPVWRLHTQYGAIDDVADYPTNFGRPGTDPTTGQSVPSCSLDLENQGGCVPGALTSWNPLENVSPFHTGTQQRHGLSVSGGSQTITYYAAGDYNREDGVYADNEQRQSHARARLTGHVGHALGLTLTSSYVDGMTRLPNGGTRFFGVVEDGLFGAAADDPVMRGFTDSLSVVLHDMGAPQRVHQSTTGFSAEWQPLRWLRSFSTVGYDRVHLSSDERRAAGSLRGGPVSNSFISRRTAAYWTDELTVQSGVDATYGDAASLSGRSSISVRHHRRRMHDRRESYIGPAERDSLSTFALSTSEMHADASTTGLYIQQHFAWRDRLFLAAGLGHDRAYHTLIISSKTPAVTDASANLSWAISSEPFFPRASWIEELRLRAAYGRTARYLDAATVPPDVLESMFTFAPVVPIGGRLTPVEPIPERTSETEAGLDATLFHGRVDAALTYYDKHSTQRAAIPSFAPLTGSGTELLPDVLRDGAALRNRGYEISLDASLVHSHVATWDVRLAGATNRNTLDVLRMPPMFLAGYPPIGSMQGMFPDYPVGAYWGRRFSFADANGDGIISRDEVQLDSAASFLGSAIPTRELSLAPTLTLFDRLTLSALVDYRGGFKQYDANDALRCRSIASGNCRAAYDPTAPLADQAAAIASRMGSNAGYIDDATFWKLREVAVTLTAPHSWAERLAASDVRLTLTGRNLATWTTYPGLDPEINATPSDPLLRGDFSTQPPVRYLVARVDVAW